MPYKSEAQRRYFHANKDKLAKQGVNVHEWDGVSKGLKLPERADSGSVHRKIRKAPRGFGVLGKAYAKR